VGGGASTLPRTEKTNLLEYLPGGVVWGEGGGGGVVRGGGEIKLLTKRISGSKMK